MAFAVAVQAGDAKSTKSTAGDKPACCSKLKTSTEAKGTCPMGAKMQTSTEAKGGCCGGGEQVAAKRTYVKHALLSPKAAASL